jgi:hypothetical protein
LQAIAIIAHGDIFRLVTIMLGVKKLLAMAKDTNGFHSIVVSKVFFQLLITPMLYNFEGHFWSTYPPISLEYQPLEGLKPSLLAFNLSLTYTFIGP